MRQLHLVLWLHKNFLTFLFLESVSLLLIFNQRVQKEFHLFHSSPTCQGVIHEFVADLQMHTKWRAKAHDLLIENADLRAQILEKSEYNNPENSVDAITKDAWDVIPARVINNSIMHSKNYITINQGADSGVAHGMGVMANSGIVGRVVAVSKHYASIISLLHTDMQVSAKLASSGVMGTICWKGNNLQKANLLYIPRYLTIAIGDKVITSGYNTTFYEGIPIGEVSHIKLDNAADFYEIVVDLSTDFSALQHVYVLKNNASREQNALENIHKSFN